MELVADAAPAVSAVSGNQLDLELHFQLAPGASLRLEVLATTDSSETTVIEVNREAGPDSHGTLRLDRTRSSLDPTVDVEEKSGPIPMPAGKVHLRVLVDRSALEIFANGKPLTARVYPTLHGKEVSLAAAAGTVQLQSLDAWTMADIFTDSRQLHP
ncbi:GH32 C-terminal domain-containing protein [Arthrobacter ulcerisalmonis]